MESNKKRLAALAALTALVAVMAAVAMLVEMPGSDQIASAADPPGSPTQKVQITDATETNIALVDGDGKLHVIVNNPRLGVVEPEETSGVAVDPEAGTDVDLVRLEGPGVFISARMSKQGGANDVTFVELEIDGRKVTGSSIAALKNSGLTEMNHFGSAVFSTDALDAVTIGYPTPLVFNDSLILRASISPGDTGIVQIVGAVVHGK